MSIEKLDDDVAEGIIGIAGYHMMGRRAAG
jgi:hypothetical protein